MPSSNPYTSTYVENYYAQLSPEEKAMLNPMYQNIGQQQNFQTQAAQQGNALTQAAGEIGKGSGGGMNALALAAMLRKKEEKPVYKGPDYGTNPDFSNKYFDKMSYD
jgi:hypothetical protein